eukprot:NODE_5275_length_676_cov_13.473588_g5112_i0.p2 GENE.NODE_5275_length_676_cov_13.473588_g5112_i0~~NODE_5275_length_676_cov_13.473588_g5112_i0.p2  ORF type:complete len:197 (+),score=75.22 NODE_5275_length_676_cov_13.473588_g5112_i0:58-591(+)
MATLVLTSDTETAAVSDVEAEAKCAEWLAAHPTGLTTTLTEGTFKAMQYSPNLFECSGPGLRMSLGFENLKPSSTLAEAQQALQHFALDRLTLPEFEPLPHWDISPRTPISSFKEGVTLTHFGEGRIALEVRSTFFAIGGQRTDIEVPACARSPPGSYFQLRQDFPFHLTIEMPFEF